MEAVSLAFFKQVLQNLKYIVDSLAHGTYIGSMRIESEKPTQLPVDSTFHFGASTRYYILRERPQNAPRPILEELEEEAKSVQDGRKLGLPESEMELDVRFSMCLNTNRMEIARKQHSTFVSELD